MTKLRLLTLATALAIAFGASPVRANLVEYDFTYNQTGETNGYGSAGIGSTTTATGTLWVDTVTNLAVSGTINVTSDAPSLSGIYYLVLGSSGGDSFGFQWDNVVTPDGPYFVDAIGIVFQNSDSSKEVNLWSNPSAQFGQPAGSYSLWGSPPQYNPESYSLGGLQFTAVPDNGMTVTLLGMSLSGLAYFRRKLA